MDQGIYGMKLKYFFYRVEFEARLAPPVHGCLWMKKDDIEPYQLERTFEYDNRKLVITLFD